MKKVKLMMMTLMMCLLTTVSFGQHLKKDGTPDRRYKENKTSTYTPPTNRTTYTTTTTTSVELPKTKDSTNKTTTTNNVTTIHLKKDGTPDRRYKENKSKK